MPLSIPKSVKSLAVDISLQNFPRRVLSSVFASVPAQPMAEPMRLLAISPSALKLIQMEEKFADQLSGQTSPGWAHCYWGSQFGSYAGQLGDGAAMLIGESGGYEINLKGSGPTPFSRGFDGRKVQRSSVREFIGSEAMAGLGIPTTRAATIFVSDKTKVPRDVNYSGRMVPEPCAVISRIAKTFFRFGSFESYDKDDSPMIKSLTEYCLANFVSKEVQNNSETLLEFVIDKTAYLIACWQSVGFTHGVMNTDNMSIIGDTIDYGPFGFVETYDPHFVPNTSDKFGRYAFSEQPRMAAWNCQKLANVLALHYDSEPMDVRNMFFEKYNLYYENKMMEKIGTNENFAILHSELFALMEKSAVDFTSVFRYLSELHTNNVSDIAKSIMETYPSVDRIKKLSATRISATDLPEIELFAQTRLNELEQAGIDLHTIARWKFHLERIESFTNGNERREECLNEWKKFLIKLAPLISDESRIVMKSVNPIYIPRQSLIQKGIDGEIDLNVLVEIFENPFEKRSYEDFEKPDLTNSNDVCLSCSS